MELFSKYRKVYVYRLGHRRERDKRITTHVGLVARAFGANGFILHGECDTKIIEKLKKVLEIWGGKEYFHIECDDEPLRFFKKWKSEGGEIIHLTMYGLPIYDVIDSIRESNRQKLIVVGAGKVPGFVYENADYNVSITTQPHSEVAALAIFLDRLYRGKELEISFSDAKLRILPSPRGKKVIRTRQDPS